MVKADAHMNPPKISRVLTQSLTNGLHLRVMKAPLKKFFITPEAPLTSGFGRLWKNSLLNKAGTIPKPIITTPMMMARTRPP